MKDTMSKLNDFVEVSCAKLREKMELMVNVFERLIEGTDTTLVIFGNNQRGTLENDEAYNSIYASDHDRFLIERRQMTEDRYKSILYGISNGTFQQNPNSIFKIDQGELQKVPSKIPLEISARSGVSEKYLVQKCQAHGLMLEDLLELIELKNEYETDMGTIFKFLSAGLSLSEVHGLYEIHRDVKDECNLSKIVIIRFCRYFNCGAINYDFFAGQLIDVCRTVQAEYGDTAIKIFLNFCKNRGICDVNHGLDAYHGGSLFSENVQ